MRLTNVAQLRLPFGKLIGYSPTVTAARESLPASFDQRRHVRGGQRPGSWMALSFKLSHQVPRRDLEAAWLAVIARHGTLRSAFHLSDDGEPQLDSIDVGPGQWVEHTIAPGQAVNDAVRDVLDEACAPLQAPSHRLCVVETAAGPSIILAADHAHVDMWSMLILVRDLLAALQAIDDGGRPELPPAPPFAAHTRAFQEMEDVPSEVRERWHDVLTASGGGMPQFPLALGAEGAQPERVEVRDVFDIETSAAFSFHAREENVSTLALAVSIMTSVTRELAGAPLRAVFPVHSRYEQAWHDSVGWFITNAVLESTDAEPRASAAAVREAIRLGSWPLDDILRPWGGMPQTPGMFAISWLDLRRLPVRIDARRLDAHYVGASIKTDDVMLWFILDDSGLHLRCRYPDTTEARANVGAWLDLLVERLQGAGRA